MVSDFSHAGLLLSSTTVLQIHDPCQRKDQYLSAALKGELTKLKAYTYPADQKVSLSNMRTRYTASSKQLEA